MDLRRYYSLRTGVSRACAQKPADGLTFDKVALMCAIHVARAASASELARTLDVSTSSVGRWLEELEGRSLSINVADSADGRKTVRMLTPSGEEEMCRILGAAIGRDVDIRPMGPTRVKQLADEVARMGRLAMPATTFVLLTYAYLRSEFLTVGTIVTRSGLRQTTVSMAVSRLLHLGYLWGGAEGQAGVSGRPTCYELTLRGRQRVAHILGWVEEL